MASKGPRSKLDHETRARRQKALEAPKEHRRPKTHWDHVLEEMVWLSKDFESERKWKLAQAKKAALRASKGMLDQATRGEKRVKEEEQRLRKVALNISKDVKKFWLKIEKLVLYKHQLELDEKKKKALDKQLEFLLGQTERYSTMLAENLVSSPGRCKLLNPSCPGEPLRIQYKEGEDDKGNAAENIATLVESQSNAPDIDEDYDVDSEDELEDDEHTLEEDEAYITKEDRDEELAALQDETDLPLEELLKRYAERASRESSPEDTAVGAGPIISIENGKENGIATACTSDRCSSPSTPGRRSVDSNGFLSDNHFSDVGADEIRELSDKSQVMYKKHIFDDFSDEQEDEDFDLSTREEECNTDDETTLSEEEKLAEADTADPTDEILLLHKESEIPVEELLSRYKKDSDSENEQYDDSDSMHASASENFTESPVQKGYELKQLKNKEDSQAVKPTICSQEERGSECREEAGEGGGESENRIADAAAAARLAQPTGNTFLTTKVRTKFPFLLKYPLREYQHIGLDWLVTMYEKKLNGILADEMGLGKTIMTIALLAHLACEKGIWGPHLIVVPTSVMLNWETEFLKWCPAFKILTYFGSAKERRIKRQGWLKPNSFHVCITTYRLVIQDSKVFKRKKWKYLILDEAHLIKNWKSQRWQTLLNFNSKRRILLTGTPLQNNLMELWSLMHFLMPHVFQSHQEFKDWFSNPISGMVEGQEKVNKEVVDRLHNVLRPFILRRLKRDVEKQLPMKQEHVIYCRLSKRQRNLYEDFIASSETQATLASSNFFGMISVIMQLRKVCNHPDLFEGRPIISSFDMSGINMQLSSSVCSLVSVGPFSDVDINGLGFQFTHLDMCMASWESEEIQAIATPSSLIEGCANLVDGAVGLSSQHKNKLHGMNIFAEIQKKLMEQRGREAKERAASIAWWNSLRCKKKPIYSTGLRELVTVRHPVYDIHCKKNNPISYSYSSKLADMILSPVERFELMANQVESFMFAIPAARAPSPVCWCCKGQTSVFIEPAYKEKCSELLSPLLTPIRPAIVRRQVYFPDRRLIQFDCGKLQELAILLRRLKLGGHRALIFTQMTKMLDILEAFINLYGYTYMRLDGSTPPEERQTLMQRFNTNPKIFIFILSTRSGGVGINLVGADTVIFYDSDWNPAMDQQAQDRCHRIGQTREVHIYRLISESTIEENILKKANQKRVLDDLVIQSGGYNTEFLKKLDPMELFSGHKTVNAGVQKQEKCNDSVEILPSNLDLEAALKYAEDEADYMALKKVEQEEAVENQEFTEEAIGRLEDDDLANDEDMKADEHTENGILTLTSNGDNDAGLGMTSNAGNVTVTSEAADTGGPTVTSSAENGDFAAILNKDGAGLPNVQDPTESQSLTLAGKDDDFDMLADVKEMAAAAAASGQTIISFENQLRPIDRYAIRFMELWDPIIDKTAVETQVQIDEKEWELDRIEKLKEDMEADIDDDEEPLVYESWDADFATEVYRQQVEALAQLQLQEELEAEAKKKELAELGNSDLASNHTPSARKPKSKKKAKKTKFKSMKKGALASEFKTVKEESQIDSMSLDEEMAFDEVTSMSDVPSPRLKLKKRKQGPYDDEDRNIKNKKFKKASEIVPLDLHSKLMGSLLDEPKHSTQSDSNFHGTELKSVSRSKLGGKISITSMPVKRILTIKPEKLKKKGNVWSKDCFPSPDFWSPHEDAVLCATVQEYGSNWRLVGEILYGMTAGGFYRGRYRHPVHCCERFRDLIQRHVLSGNDTVNNDKVGNASSGKGLLKVTEDNIKTLVDVASQLSDPEPLVQKHFFNLFSSVWRVSTRGSHRGSLVHSPNSLYSSGRLMNSSMDHFSRDISRQPSEKMPFTNLSFSSKLVASALSNDHRSLKDDQVPKYNQKEEAPLIPEKLDVTLELLNNQDDKTVSLPALVNLSILEPYSPPSSSMRVQEDNRLRSSQNLAANRFRDASRVCAEDCMSWASLAFPTGDAKSRNPVKSQSLGKHKLLSDSTKTSRGKMRKTAVDSGNVHNNSMGAPVAQPPATISNIFRIDEDLASSSLPDVGIHELYWISPFDIDDELASLTESTEMASHEYVPSLTSGLDDYLTLPEFADIG